MWEPVNLVWTVPSGVFSPVSRSCFPRVPLPGVFRHPRKLLPWFPWFLSLTSHLTRLGLVSFPLPAFRVASCPAHFGRLSTPYASREGRETSEQRERGTQPRETRCGKDDMSRQEQRPNLRSPPYSLRLTVGSLGWFIPGSLRSPVKRRL